MKLNPSIALCMLLTLSACSSLHGPDTDRSSGRQIYLRADVDGTTDTKAPYTPSDNKGDMLTYPTPSYPLKAYVWGSTTAYSFMEEYNPDNNNLPYDGSGELGKVAIHTDAIFQSGNPQLLRAAIYNETTKPTVFFVAFSPMSENSWDTTDGTKAFCSFSGHQDLMFAPQVEGTYAQDYAKSPVLSFHHLLTWLRIEVKAENESVSNSWGKLKEIRIKSKTSVEINLKEDAYDQNGRYIFSEDNISYSNEQDLTLLQVEKEVIYEGHEIKTKKVYSDKAFPVSEKLIPYNEAEEVAYILCSPVTATSKTVVEGVDSSSAEYILEIVTDSRTVTIPVDLMKAAGEPFTGSTRCNQFTLLLNFKMGNTVYVASSVSDWQAGGIVTGDMTDDDITAN